MTIGELLIASAITIALMGAVLGVMASLQRVFDTQPELADMHQRMRVAVGALTKDLLAAAPPVMPYRSGVRRHDPGLGVFFRSDTVTLVSTPWEGEGGASRTYYLKKDVATGVSQLMLYDGNESDLPLADHVEGLEFAYFGGDGSLLPAASFQDGPWFPDDADGNRFDTDLLRIRRVRVTVRVQAASAALRRVLPDREIRFDITPRNLNRE